MKFEKQRCFRCKKWVSETMLVLNPMDENDSEKAVCVKCKKVLIEKKEA